MTKAALWLLVPIVLFLSFVFLVVVRVALIQQVHAQSAVSVPDKRVLYGRDFFTHGPNSRTVEIDESGGLARQVRLWQAPAVGSNCNVGRYGIVDTYLYVCRPLDGTTYGMWVRTKVETVW